MLFINDGAMCFFGGAVMQFGVSGIELRGISATFPYAIFTPPTNTSSSLTLNFTVATAVSIDYGDGNSINYPPTTFFNVTSSTGDTPQPHAIYYYPDGQVKERIVKISYDRSKLLTFRMVTSMGGYNQPFLFSFANHPALSSFQLLNTSFATDVDIDQITTTSNPNLKTLDIRFFAAGSKYYTQIPINLLLLPLETFSFGNGWYIGLTDAETNMDKVVLLKNTLLRLEINDLNFTDSRLPPSNWAELTKLVYLNANNCVFSKIPAVFKAWTNITTLIMSLGASLTSFEGFEVYTLLSTFNMSGPITQLNPAGYFNNLNNFRNIVAVGKLTTAAMCTTFSTNWYNHVVANASLAPGIGKFRRMTIDIRGTTTAPTQTVIPDGIYQAPAGYQKNINVGDAVSSMERFYVMTDTFEHIISFRIS